MDMRDMRLETARLEAERRLVRLRSEVARCVLRCVHHIVSTCMLAASFRVTDGAAP
jgi:hypothetical protein